MERVVIEQKWIENVKLMLNDEQMKDFCYGLVHYGLYGQKIEFEDSMVEMALSFVFPQIDNMQADYQRKVDYGKNVGRRAALDKFEVWRMARAGKNSKEIADELGVSASTIRNNEGWKNRNDAEFG